MSLCDGTTLGVQMPLMGNFKGPPVTYVMSFMTITCTPISFDQVLLGVRWCFLL